MIPFLNKTTPGSKIADLGCGNGAIWWDDVPSSCTSDAYDLYSAPKIVKKNFHFYQKDITKLAGEKGLKGWYDLVVAAHVFEHVGNAAGLMQTISFLSGKRSFLYAAIPDATNFTDRFYRLIHRDSGGHVSQFSRDSFVDLAKQCKFELLEAHPWADDWVWLERLFSLERYNVKFFTQEELQYIVEVFRKELTLEKGYFYGWEFLFQKTL